MTSRTIPLLVSFLLLSSPCVFGLAVQDGPPSPIEGFYPIGDYMLEIDGATAPRASFYLAEHGPALLIETPELPSLVMLRPGTGEVKTVPPENLAKQSDGTARLTLDSAVDQGKLQILASWVVFRVDGHQMTLKQRPWLLAQQSSENLLRYSPEFAWRADAYHPDQAIIEKLQGQARDVRVQVFFGSWCAHCKRHVPLMIKVAQELAGSRIRIDYYGLPRGWSGHPVAGPLNITAVPTGIVYVEEQEVGRITGEQWSSPERALEEILERPAQASHNGLVYSR